MIRETNDLTCEQEGKEAAPAEKARGEQRSRTQPGFIVTVVLTPTTHWNHLGSLEKNNHVQVLPAA